MDALLPIVRLGVTLYPKTQHGAYFEDMNERKGSLYVLMNRDGTPGSEDETMEIEDTYYEANGEACASSCFLCRESEWIMKTGGTRRT